MKMQITNDDVVLHRDATAQVRWRTLLGGLMFIDIDPGSKSAPELGDNPIPVTRTDTQVELDQVLQPYDGYTSQAQRNLFKGLRDTLADPDAVGRTIQTLSPAMDTIGKGLRPLRGRESDDLSKLVAATAETVEGLDSIAEVRRLVTGGNQTLAITTARREELGELLELSPGSLDSTFTTMRRLRTTLDHLDPLAVRLRPGARALDPAARAATPALVQTEAFLREARPLLRAARPAFDGLRGASANGVPLMQGLKPTLERLDKELLPFLRETDPETRLKNYEAIGPFSATLASAAAETDAEGPPHPPHRATQQPQQRPGPAGRAVGHPLVPPEQALRGHRHELLGRRPGAVQGLVRQGEGAEAMRMDRQRLALEIRRARGGFIALLALLVLAIGAAAVIANGLRLNMPWHDTYTARVAVDDAKGVVAGKQQVRISGLPVGKIDESELVDGKPVLTITLRGKYAPLYKDARLRLRPKTPLADLYLNVEDRGHKSAGELKEGDVLAAERTQAPVDIGKVMNALNASTRTRMEHAIDALGRGLPDNGDSFRAALIELAPFLNAAERLTKVTAERRGHTRRLVHNFRLMMEELGRRDNAVRRLVEGGSRTFDALADAQAPLSRLFAEFPPTLAACSRPSPRCARPPTSSTRRSTSSSRAPASSPAASGRCRSSGTRRGLL